MSEKKRKVTSFRADVATNGFSVCFEREPEEKKEGAKGDACCGVPWTPPKPTLAITKKDLFKLLDEELPDTEEDGEDAELTKAFRSGKGAV